MTDGVSETTTGDVPISLPQTSTTRRIRIARLRDFALVPAVIAVAVVGYAVNPVFLHKGNLILILQTMSEVGVLVLAEALILIAGRMDLSLESTFGLAPGLAAWLLLPGAPASIGLGSHLPSWTGIPLTLAAGAVIGAINGLLIVKYRLNGFIVTLGMLIVLRGLLTGISKGQTFFNLPKSMLWIGQTYWLTVPVAVWLCLGLFGVAMFILGYTRAGRSLYAIGGNPNAARAAGINVDRVLWITLIICSTLAALGGLMLTGRLASVAANQGNGYIFTVFASAVIGGISLNGGKGTMFGAFTGVLLLYMIQDVLTLAGVHAEWIGALDGAIILLALVLSRITSGQAQD
jgi:simple sugar transport system permease protein